MSLSPEQTHGFITEGHHMSLTPMGVTTQGHGCFVLKAEFELNRLRMEVSEPYKWARKHFLSAVQDESYQLLPDPELPVMYCFVSKRSPKCPW
jgi:hypothetical protein